jgi:hypothetical protein
MKELTAFRKFLAEGIIKEEIMIHAKDYWQDPTFLKSLEAEQESEIIDFIKNTYTGDMSMSSFSDTLSDFLTVSGQAGGDVDLVISMLEWHVENKYMTSEEAGEAMLEFWDDDTMDADEIEDIKSQFKLAEGKLLKESIKRRSKRISKLINENAPGYDTRKQGEALPTLESVKAAYEAKNFKSSNLPVDNPKVETIIQMLKDIDVDGETMQYILTQVDMEDQMQSQLDNSSAFDNKFKGTTPDDIDF